MAQDKFCPPLSTDTNYVWCNADCAWWDKKHEKCAVAVLASVVSDYDNPTFRVDAEVAR